MPSLRTLWIVVAVMAIGVGTWLATGPLANAGRTTTLDRDDRARLEAIERALEVFPTPAPDLAHAERLTARMAPPSRAARVSVGRLVYPPFKPVTIVCGYPVPGELSLPHGLTVSSKIDGVSLGWKRCECKHVEAVEYRVYREGCDEPLATIPATDADEYSFTDTDVEAESAYTYTVRVFGKAAPPREGQEVLRPDGVEVKGELWASPASAAVTAKTPSGIEFKCVNLGKRHGGWRAVITVKEWDPKAGKWRPFSTESGTAEGAEIIAYRPDGIVGKKELRTGYVVKEIVPEKIIEAVVPGYTYDETGRRVPHDRTVRTVRRYIVIAHPDKGFEKEYDVGK